MRIVFVLFIAFTSIFSVCFGENAAKTKKKRKEKNRVRFPHQNREQNWQGATKAHFIGKRSGSRSASWSKIQLEEPEEESQLSSSTPSADGTWKTVSGRAIVSSEKLLQKRDESVSCRFCQGRVQVMENVATKHGPGSTWRIQCENESCLSHKTNSVFNSSELSRAFEINRASVLGLQAIGCGHSASLLSFVLISHWFSASLPS